MQKVESGSSISVRIGERFAVSRSGAELSGYEASVIAPSGITHLGTRRTVEKSFGGSPHVVESFRCDRPGDYVIEISEGRPWEGKTARMPLAHVICGRP